MTALADVPSCEHPVPGDGDAGGDGGRALARSARQELVGVRAAQRNDEVEAVQQRCRDAAPVAGAGGGRARAGTFVDALAARARVHRRDEKEGRREGGRPAGAAHPDHPLLERLAQCFEGGHRELAELIEEEDAMGGQADLTRAQRPAAAADKRDEGRLVMRGAEGWAVEQRAVGHGAARSRVDPGHGEGLLGREAREEPGQALGEHGLARAGRPDHEEVVATGGGNLERPSTDRLAPHVGEIRLFWGIVGGRRDGHIGPAHLPAQHAGQLGQRRCAMDGVPADEQGLPHVAQRHHQAEGRRGVGQRDHARHVPQRAVEPELSAERQPLAARGTQLTGGDEEPDGDGEVEASTALTHARWRKVDGDPSQRP